MIGRIDPCFSAVTVIDLTVSHLFDVRYRHLRLIGINSAVIGFYRVIALVFEYMRRHTYVYKSLADCLFDVIIVSFVIARALARNGELDVVYKLVSLV